MDRNSIPAKGFIPFAAAAFLIGIVGGFSTVLGPAFVNDMGLAYRNTTWTALAQAMSTAACAPILGKLGDSIGRKTTLLSGLAVFTLGNILSASANSLSFMIAARFIVGIGTASLTPVIMAYIIAEFPQNKIAKGFALYMLLSSASVICGPILGSWIISAYGWRTMLWVCTALCVGTFAVCLPTIGRDHPNRKPLRRFDKSGALLVLIFFSLVLCIPSFGQNFGWGSGAFLFVLIAAILSLLSLIYIERHASEPILPGRFIRRRAFFLSIISLFFTQGLMQANMTNTIVFVNYTQPDNPIISGFAVSFMYFCMSFGAVLLGPLADRFEPKFILLFNLILTGLGCSTLFLFSVSTSVFLLMGSLGLLGFGLGGNGTIFMKVALSGLPAQNAGAGTGTYGLFRDLAAPLGVAVFVPLFTNQITTLTAGGITESYAAVRSIHALAGTELLCVAAGAAAVLFLPKTVTKEPLNETTE